MNILFITDLYPIKAGETTTPVTLHNFVFDWIKQGHKVDVIKPNFVFNSFLRRKPFYSNGFYEYEGVKIFNVNYFSPFLFDISKKLQKDAKMQRCKDAKKNLNYASMHLDLFASEKNSLASDYDIIIAHMPSGLIFANKLAKTIRKPLVCGVHCSDIEVLTNPIYKIYFKTQLEDAYKHAEKIACRSFVLQKKFNEILPQFQEKTFVAPSGIEAELGEITIPPYSSLLTAFSQHNSPLQPAVSSPIKVLTCANLIKRKNIDKIILAIKDLEGFELNIIGDGKELSNLKNLTSRVGLLSHQHKINFLGRLAHEKALEKMQASDIFILPSINETFGMVYLEAMAADCITICTKNDGIDGIIKDNENGFLCEPTAQSIKETLLKIKNLKNIGKILENSHSTIQNYTREACAKNYIDNLL